MVFIEFFSVVFISFLSIGYELLLQSSLLVFFLSLSAPPPAPQPPPPPPRYITTSILHLPSHAAGFKKKHLYLIYKTHFTHWRQVHLPEMTIKILHWERNSFLQICGWNAESVLSSGVHIRFVPQVRAYLTPLPATSRRKSSSLSPWSRSPERSVCMNSWSWLVWRFCFHFSCTCRSPCGLTVVFFRLSYLPPSSPCPPAPPHEIGGVWGWGVYWNPVCPCIWSGRYLLNRSTFCNQIG